MHHPQFSNQSRPAQSRDRRRYRAKGTNLKIHLLKLRVSNAYLLTGDQPILVDTGSPSDIELIRSKLRDFNVELRDLALIVHTHVHSDHIGSTAEIVAEANCPIAYHPADQEIADRSHNGRLNGIGLRGRIMSRFFSDAKFDSVTGDIHLSSGLTLDDYGCNATVVETPGHTPGSISIVTPEGDAIIGDVIMGGYIGGNVWPTRPNYHYFADDVEQAMKSLDTLLSHTKRTMYVGHGGPLAWKSVHNWRKRQRNAR